ncbi:LIM domain-binding protein [Aspergillus clavatus NRRL 1]|uniref:PtaB protein, putative n=1 Tax=Aspergillus clavatus (strain ATCC 1007 / CBS 513.65 / DSM 816 / NCTC 3887 / NRRL 1 / QM 1276 / 107) TaxID=344612 RepID=A1C6W9_ASPCL|nr:PtaB protein, putative [Aspergillus clavatus NRRL 1]EAW14140.1 PtaB protein, putative [Aspergillus clavatus NRRL 1]
MMMAQPFPAHQGIPQHPGLPPGHPMAPGQHPNAHPGAGMVQGVHPGVSAPGPQVTQGGPMMAGMPPGAGTTGPGPVQAHALSHLGPAQAHLFQQPQFAQTFANNPQLLQQHQQQQQILRQRMMFQQQQAQQQQHAGLPVSLPNGTQGLNAAQIAAMQANPAMRPVNLQMHLHQMPHGPQNIQQQQQQLFAMQQVQQAQQAHQAQQQAQQAAAAAAAAAAGQQGQHTPQQRAAAQPQTMHDAQSVTPQPQPPPHQGSSTPQSNPPRPSSTQPHQQPGAAPQPQQTPNPAPQQLPQAQQPGQQQQQQQQQPPQPQLQQGQPQNQQPQMTPQEAQLKAQQSQNQAAMMMQQRMAMKNASILCLHTFAEHLSNFSSRGEVQDLLYWQAFVDRFYSPMGVLRQGVYNPQAGSKQFEISTPALARYYLTQFTSGIRQIQMLVEGARERDSPNGGHIVESPKTSFIYWFTNDSQLFTNGTLRAHFDHNNKIEMLDIVVMNHTEFLPRSQLQALEIFEQKQSPKVSKNMGKRGQQKQAPQITPSLPESMVTANGVPTAVMSFLEVAETISHMQMLFQFSQQNPQLSPPEALRNLVNTLQSQNSNPGYMPGPINQAMQQAQNPRGPHMNAPNQFASPAMAHLGLPAQGSPHLSAHPSPAQSHLAGPPGMVQPGQMPPNVGQVTSASASPQVSSKRRRASTVKVENDESGGAPELNGTAPQGVNKVPKASPRFTGKRQKGTA